MLARSRCDTLISSPQTTQKPTRRRRLAPSPCLLPPPPPPSPKKKKQRSEHNDGALSTLEEIDLHQEGLTRLGPRLRRACPKLQHLSLSGNALGRLSPGETRGLRSLKTLGLALNCLRRFPPRAALAGLESLKRLDLTGNFLGASALLGLGRQLGCLPRLAELWLMGNPCVSALGRAAAAEAAAAAAAAAQGGQDGGARGRRSQNDGEQGDGRNVDDAYRACVVLALPHLVRLDGEPVSASARLAARRAERFVARALRRAAADEAEAEAAAAARRGDASTLAAALEASILAGEEHPETVALYGPGDAAVEDETSESEEEGEGGSAEGKQSGLLLPPPPPVPAAAAAAAAVAVAARRRPHRRPRILETGTKDPETGELRRPWCPATRLLDLRDQRRQLVEAAAARRDKPRGDGASAAAAAAAASLFADPLARRERREALPPLPDQDPGTGETLPLRNEGRWRFSLDVVPAAVAGTAAAAAAAAPAPRRNGCLAAASAAPSSAPAAARPPGDVELELELDVDVGRYVDTAHMSLEVLPRAVRLLVRGRLLQLRLPAEVRADAAAARRSAATGRLRVALPLERPWGRGAGEDPTLLHPRSVWGEEEGAKKGVMGKGPAKEEVLRPKRRAAVVAVAAAAAASASRGDAERERDTGGDNDDDDDRPPPLL